MSKFGTKIKVELTEHGCFPTKAYETDKVRENLDVILGLIDCGYGEEVHVIVKSGRWKWKNRILRLLGFKFLIPYSWRICQGAFTYVPDVNLEPGKVTGTRKGLGSTDS